MASFRPEKLTKWIVFVPVGIAVAALSVANRSPTNLRFDPLPFEIEAPLYLLILLSVLAGVLVGGAVTFVSRGVWRRRARASERRAQTLERNIEVLESQLQAAANSGAGGTATE